MTTAFVWHGRYARHDAGRRINNPFAEPLFADLRPVLRPRGDRDTGRHEDRGEDRERPDA